ncbi:MAG: hypothetical protein EZS26_000921 [Candidatus Ordinivivax streblomastigis]|uniref:T9SS C-terminal target domain-containing protein n=1 Tax=Candidatus Ordinivivax streblomastigis TaxID=2540710 RepID=A0A5M8P2V7_9BACT|nr:MAG: hypothetical protein EZS26_000921 [Candidatus Ordinivivax streblomastigis]
MKKTFFYSFLMALGLLGFNAKVAGEVTPALPVEVYNLPDYFTKVTDFSSFTSGESLYVYNEGTGKFLSQGSNWGTRAVVSLDDAKSFAVEKYADESLDDYYILKINNTVAGTGNRLGLAYTGVSDIYTDGAPSNTGSGQNKWSLTAVTGGKFKISSYYTAHLASPITDAYLAPNTLTDYNVVTLNDATSADRNEWSFYSFDAGQETLFKEKVRLYKLIKVANESLAITENSAVQAAYEAAITVWENGASNLEVVYAGRDALALALGQFVVNPNFDGANYNERLFYWDYSAKGYNVSGINTIGFGNGTTEIYRRVAVLTQTISNLPAGLYRFSAQAFGGSDAFLYATTSLGTFETKLPVLANGETNTATAAASFALGLYPVSVDFTLTEPGNVSFGVNSKVNNLWTIFNSFKLERIGGLDAPATAEQIDALQAIIENANNYLASLAGQIQAETEEQQPGQYAYADALALTNKIAEALTHLADTPKANQTLSYGVEINALVAALENSYKTAKNSLSVGDYYIKKTASDLYWTNMKAVTNEEKPEFKALYEENIDEQLWTITLDGGRYKIVNVHQDTYSGDLYNRFITEKGTFPQSNKIASGYTQAWNTFDLFYNGTAYAVQRTGSASHEFWRLDDSNFVIWSSTTLNIATDFILDFISVNTVLEQAVVAGQAKLENAVIGNANGQYLQSVYDDFDAALIAASAKVTAGTATAQDLITFKAAEALFIPNEITGLVQAFAEKLIVVSQEKAIRAIASEKTTVSVYNLIGALVYQTTISEETIIPLESGIYLVKADNKVSKVIVK